MSTVALRPLRLDDAPDDAQIFFDAVHEGTKQHYTEDQRRAWGGDAPDPAGWRGRLLEMAGFVAEQDGQPVGFMTIDAKGFIDLAFVSPSASGRGIGRQLYRAVEQKARDLGASVLTTEASKAAKSFFEKQGWSVIAEQTVVKDGVALTNFRMRKSL
ncbi:MAG: GNAT family N-acetyltransferase [Hyphomicrobiales bacterium]|nr:GNAT family N-acetyltransferase [Hyphomicrobiales bacterium]